MRDTARIDAVLATLGAYWRLHPDLRLAQIIGNAYGKPVENYQMEDEALVDYLGGQRCRIAPPATEIELILCDSSLASETDHLDCEITDDDTQDAALRMVAQGILEATPTPRETTIAHLRSLPAEGLLELLREARVCLPWVYGVDLLGLDGKDVAVITSTGVGFRWHREGLHCDAPDLPSAQRAAEDAAIAQGYRVPWRQE